MSNNLVLKDQKEEKGILSYLVPLDEYNTFIEREKVDLLGYLNLGVIGANIANMELAKKLIVDVPEHLREGLNNGSYHLGNSNVQNGNFCPNVYDENNNLVGQVTLKEGVDYSKVTSSITSIALLAQMQQMNNKLDEILEIVQDIKQTQTNKTIAKITSAFSSFVKMYPNLTEAEMRIQAQNAYAQMETGLQEFLFEIDELKKKLDKAPKNAWHKYLYGLNPKNFGQPVKFKYKPIFQKFFSYIMSYQYFLVLQGLVFSKVAKDQMAVNKIFKDVPIYFEDKLSLEFRNKMCYALNQNLQNDFDLLLNTAKDMKILGSNQLQIETNVKQLINK